VLGDDDHDGDIIPGDGSELPDDGVIHGRPEAGDDLSGVWGANYSRAGDDHVRTGLKNISSQLIK